LAARRPLTMKSDLTSAPSVRKPLHAIVVLKITSGPMRRTLTLLQNIVLTLQVIKVDDHIRRINRRDLLKMTLLLSRMTYLTVQTNQVQRPTGRFDRVSAHISVIFVRRILCEKLV